MKYFMKKETNSGSLNLGRRLAGLLALALVLAMTMGMTVCAAGSTYYVHDGKGERLYTDIYCTSVASQPLSLRAGDTLESKSGTYLVCIDGADKEVIGSIGGEARTYSIDVDGSFTWEVGAGDSGMSDDISYANTIYLYSYSSDSDEPSCPHSAVELRGVRETTETVDGIRAWFCVDCGAKLSEEYLSSYSFFLESIIWQIENAEEGATIEISSEIWHSLSQDVMLALASRRDITFVFTLRYEHEDYRIEIPAGTKIDTKDEYYGPIYLGRLYGMTKLEK